MQIFVSTFSAGKVVQKHDEQENTGEISTNKKEKEGRLFLLGNLCHLFVSIFKLGKQHFPALENKHERLNFFSDAAVTVSTTACITSALTNQAWDLPFCSIA